MPGPQAPAPPSPSRRGLSALLDALRQHARSAWRNLAARPLFAALAVLTLALGIGANTAAFSVLYGVVLSRLPYPEPDRLVEVYEVNATGSQMSVAGANFRDWVERTESFEALAAYSSVTTTVLGAERPALAPSAAVSERFFDVLGVRPFRGRTMLPEEHREGGDPAAVVSHRFWRSHLGGGPIEDRTLDVWGFELRVVGVMPPSLDFPADTDVWFPMVLFPRTESRTAHNWSVVGRLADGVSPAQADAELDAVTRGIVEPHRGEDPQLSEYLAAEARLVPLLEDLTAPVRRPLLLLFGAAALVLLVACSNLASAFLARGIEREGEIAVRVSLGASPRRLLGQLFTESLAVALAGAAAGLGLGWLVVRLVTAEAAEALPRVEAIGLHGPVLAFTLAASVVTAVLFGVLPGLRLVRGAPERALHRGETASAGPGRRRAWQALVAAEVALALVLLAGSGLLMRSLWQTLQEDPGFDPERVTAVAVHLPASLYPEPEDRRDYFREALAELGAHPEVATAGVVSHLPLDDSGPNGSIEVEGGAAPRIDAEYRVADANYFRTLEIPLLAGRHLAPRDHAEAPHAVVVNRALAETAWPGQDPLGKRLTGGGMDPLYDQDVWATVVGVVGDVRQQDLTASDRPTVYFHHLQRPYRLQAGDLVVRTRSAAEDVATALGAVVRRIDSQVPYRVRPMDRVVTASVARERFSATLLGGFALVALVLAAVGIYGVVSYTVAQRRRELGVRLALGATPRRVQRLVVGGSMATILAGIGLGVAGSVAGGRVLASLLYEVEPADPATLAAVSALLAATGLAATWLPARQTARIDPQETLRAE
ncbi:MAG: ABC transporter permease [Thermoanaerobaculia bacterium]